MKPLLALSTFLLFAGSVLSGAEGVVVLKKQDCKFFLVESKSGFALLKKWMGHDPNKDDVVIGEFESIGFKKIHYKNKEGETRVIVFEYGLSKGQALEKYYDNCKDKS